MTFSRGMKYACPGSGLGTVDSSLNIEENLRERHDVLQVEHPPQVHLDGEAQHEQEQRHPQVVSGGAHLAGILVEAQPSQEARKLFPWQGHDYREDAHV